MADGGAGAGRVRRAPLRADHAARCSSRCRSRTGASRSSRRSCTACWWSSCVRWPSPLRWLVGTALLSGLHVLLGLARGPVSAFLDPSLAGRPLPWVLPPPLPELVGLILLLVPLRDLLRARPRSARERTSAAGRAPSPVRGRARSVAADAARSGREPLHAERGGGRASDRGFPGAGRAGGPDCWLRSRRGRLSILTRRTRRADAGRRRGPSAAGRPRLRAPLGDPMSC